MHMFQILCYPDSLLTQFTQPGRLTGMAVEWRTGCDTLIGIPSLKGSFLAYCTLSSHRSKILTPLGKVKNSWAGRRSFFGENLPGCLTSIRGSTQNIRKIGASLQANSLVEVDTLITPLTHPFLESASSAALLRCPSSIDFSNASRALRSI